MHHWHDAPSPPSEARHEARSGRPLQPAEDVAAGAARMVAALPEGGVAAAARRRRAGSFMGDWGVGGVGSDCSGPFGRETCERWEM